MRTYCLATSWSGSLPTHFRALGDELARRGHRVILLVPHRRVDIIDERSNPAVLTWPSTRPTHWADARWFARLVRREQPHGVIANFGATNIMLTVGAALGVPVRVEWYHTVLEAIRLDAPVTWKSVLLLWRKRVVYRAATHFAAVSEAAREDLARVYGISLARITRVGLSLPDPGTSGNEVRPMEVLCVGRMYPTKGQDVFLRALALLPQEVRGVLVGDGPACQDYHRLAESLGVADRCSFVGAVPPSEVLLRMARATITVVPSRAEAFGLVNIESMAVGTPVVASRVGGIPEIVRDGIDGLLVPSGDHAAMADAIVKVLYSPGLRGTMSTNARQRFLDVYEQRGVIARQASWIESLE